MRRLVLSAAVLGAIPLLAAAAPSDSAFDIVCDVSTTLNAVGPDGGLVPSGPPRRSQLRYAVDLSSMRWCTLDRCARDGTHPVTSADQNTISFGLTPSERDLRSTSTYDRRQGRFEATIQSPADKPMILVRSSGTCRIEAFTPFPARQETPAS